MTDARLHRREGPSVLCATDAATATAGVGDGSLGLTPSAGMFTSGELSRRLDDYIKLQEALGYSMDARRGRLRDLVRFLEVRLEDRPITAQDVVDWVHSSARAGRPGQVCRLNVARGFLAYLHAFFPATQVPASGLLGGRGRPRPYVYSASEMASMIRNARLLPQRRGFRRRSKTERLSPHTYATFFGLLLSTGLRLREAVDLSMADVHLEDRPPVIVVRNGKFRKTRMVPLHPSVAKELARYATKKRELGYDGYSDSFFVSERANRLQPMSVHHSFHRVLSLAGIARTRDGRRPTLHACRHTFAVRRLVAWQEAGVDVRAMLPHLSVYLGHVNPRNTYWYLSATPELLGSAAASFERYAEGTEA
ncbi:MAG: tyrosine-type recombinase/integrase [Acidobacteriota bacterium]